MPVVSRRFDDYLNGINADKLKAMVRSWGLKGQMRKDECIQAIRQALDDPKKATAVVAGLEAYERFGLALIKQMGGEIEANGLSVGLYSSGIKLPPRLHGGYRTGTAEIFEHFFRRGLVMNAYTYDPGYLYSRDGSESVFSDERLLAEVGFPEIIPFKIDPAPAPLSSSYRRPQTVALDVISILQAIENMGGMLTTKSGMVRNTELRKLMRALRWEENEIGVDGFRFPNPTQAWISVLSLVGLLTRQEDRLALSESPALFAHRSYPEQAALLLHGFVRTSHWNEQWKERWQSYHVNYYSDLRLALKLALTALPVEAGAWYKTADLDKALFDRIGDHFSLDYLPSKPYFFNKTSEEIRKEEAEWRAKLRISWLKRERKWLEQALISWVYFLGVVELGIEGGAVASLRLTELGRSVLHPELGVGPERPQEEKQPPWIVQPNFEVVVYLDRATPGKLAFLEKHAERVQAQQHTAVYRLTRDSVYRGLESGTSPEDLLQGLRAGSEAELPQNVAVEIREWAGLREKISLRRRGRLLEFRDSALRQAAAAQGLEGIPVGERFLLLPDLPPGKPAPDRNPGWDFKPIDYSRPLPRCLSANESGEIKLKTDHPDLMLAAQIERWAARKADGGWQLSQASVIAASKRGARIADLLELLSERLTHSLPRLLRVALLAWAGQRQQAELSTVTLLRCRNPEAFQAIASSKMLKPYLLGQIAPDVLVVDPTRAEALKERLDWAGLEVKELSL